MTDSEQIESARRRAIAALLPGVSRSTAFGMAEDRGLWRAIAERVDGKVVVSVDHVDADKVTEALRGKAR